MIIGGPQMGISYIHSIPPELCIITEQYAVSPVMYNHSLAKWNTRVAIILLKNLHMLQMIQIQTFVRYGSLYPECGFTILVM
jgi:hypothetical protein